MPFYEYECAKCGHTLEAMQRISDPPLRKCPNCGKLSLKKQISRPVFRLKGSGWYETDFKSDGESKRNLADRPEKEEKKDDAKKAESKPEAKPETKTETKTETKPETQSQPAGNAAGGAKSSKASVRASKRPARKPK